MSYDVFARYYDALTQNVGYAERADYLCALLDRYHHPAGETLDLACGTGSLTLALKQRGLDIYGVDGSVEMLAQAQAKAAQAGEQILFLHQKMQALDLYGSVNTVFCTLDSLNHLPTERDLQATFARVAHFLESGGLFVFDMNTPYKHREVLGNNTFVYDTDAVYCVWQNHYMPAGCRVAIVLDFFAREGMLYRRKSERFFERAYEIPCIRQHLQQTGLNLLDTFAEQSFSAPVADTQRVVFVARKPEHA